MKTIREILKEGYIRSQLFRIKEDAELWQVEVTQELLDQALKELEELLLGCKPEKKKIDHSLLSGNQGNIANGGYNQALDDYEKNIKKAIGGK